MANLTLRQAGGGKWYGIDIAQGRLIVEDCDISSQSRACVAIRGGADPLLRRNRIHDSRSAGVFVHENGRGTLEDNEIHGHAREGVTIASGGRPVLRRNRITGNRRVAVWLLRDGGGEFTDNDLRGNSLGAWITYARCRRDGAIRSGNLE